MSESWSPKDLSRELSVSEKAIRGYLRSKYGKLKPFEIRWVLDAIKANDVRDRFSSGG